MINNVIESDVGPPVSFTVKNIGQQNVLLVLTYLSDLWWSSSIKKIDEKHADDFRILNRQVLVNISITV